MWDEIVEINNKKKHIAKFIRIDYNFNGSFFLCVNIVAFTVQTSLTLRAFDFYSDSLHFFTKTLILIQNYRNRTIKL